MFFTKIDTLTENSYGIISDEQQCWCTITDSVSYKQYKVLVCQCKFEQFPETGRKYMRYIGKYLVPHRATLVFHEI